MISRSIILFLTSSLLLVGCLRDTGKYVRPMRFDACSLAVPHTYRIPTQSCYVPWWSKFNDPQLTRLILIGLNESPTIHIAQSRLARATSLTKLAQSSLWPNVTLYGYEQRQRFSKFGIVPPPFNGETFNIADIGLQFRYEVDFWGKYREIVATEVSEACAAYADLAQARLILSTAIASQYFWLQNQMTQLAIAKAIFKQRRELLEIIMDLSHHDIESDIPVKTGQISVDSAALNVKQYEQRVALARHQLAVLIGKNPINTTIEMPDFDYERYAFKLPRVICANVLANRPDVLASRNLTEAQAHKINVAKSLFFPNINLLGLFSYQTIKFGELFNPESQNNFIMGAFDLPIFDAGARRANLSRYCAEYSASVNRYNQTILNALNQVANELSILHVVDAQLAIQNNSVRAIKTSDKLVRARFRHGIVAYERVLIVRGQLLEQQAKQVNLQTKRLTTIVALYRALGGYEQG